MPKAGAKKSNKKRSRAPVPKKRAAQKKKSSQKKAPSVAPSQKKAPLWYLYAIIVLNVLGLFFLFTLNMFGEGWLTMVTVIDFLLGFSWWILNIYFIIKFCREKYETKAKVLPIYYVLLFLTVYLVTGMLAKHGIVIEIYFFYWLAILTAVFEVAYAQYLIKDQLFKKKVSQ